MSQQKQRPLFNSKYVVVGLCSAESRKSYEGKLIQNTNVSHVCELHSSFYSGNVGTLPLPEHTKYSKIHP